MNFFDLTQKIVYVKGGQTDGRIKIEREELEEVEEASTNSGCDLCKDEGSLESSASSASLASLESLESFSQLPDSMFGRLKTQHKSLTHKTNIYSTYYDKSNKHYSYNFFAVTPLRQKVIETVALKQVTIITGATGCGKTTQIPQFLLDWHAYRKMYCNIIVVQPRRVSAISVCKRVCQERGWNVGSLCGYRVGLLNSTTDETRLAYVTTGVFLQMLLNQNGITPYTHIIFDEIHEREQIMDFSLLVVKKYLSSVCKDTKLILMSATAEVTRFSKFFPRKIREFTVGAPVINILTPTKYEVETFYLDYLTNLGKLSKMSTTPQVTKEMFTFCIKLLAQFDVIDYRSDEKAAVLIFLPGISSIEELYSMILDYTKSECGEPYKWHPVPVHGSISIEDQIKAFHPAPPGYRKIVIATNIAESSITIPDVSIVIDFCLTKILVTNDETNVVRLDCVWASKANLCQRAGRVGRVGNGLVYRLIPYNFTKTEIPAYTPPDITRCLAERTTLQCMAVGMGNPHKFFRGALDPPRKRDVARTTMILRELGAIPLKTNDPSTFEVTSITLLGRLMSVMPLELKFTRLIALGYVFSVFKEAVIMAACMNTKGVFVFNFNKKMKYYDSKLRWADGTCSDAICYLNLYQTWKKHLSTGYFERTPFTSERSWADRNCVQLATLYEVDKVINELMSRLKNFGMEELEEEKAVVWSDWEKEFILRIVIAGAFYPSYFVQTLSTSRTMEQNAVEFLSGRDPFRTAHFSNFPRNEPLDAYTDLVEDYLLECDDEPVISTDYDRNVFVTFPRNKECVDEKDSDVPFNPRIPGGIPLSVYKAYKLRFTQKYLEFKRLSKQEAREKKLRLAAEKEEKERQQEEDCVARTVSFRSDVPPKDKMQLNVKVTHVADPNLFWCVAIDERGLQFQKELKSHLDSFKAKLEVFSYTPKVGQLCVVKCDEDEGAMYRGKIIFVDLRVKARGRDGKEYLRECKRPKKSEAQKDNRVKIFYGARVYLIDVGKTKFLKSDCIMKYSLGLYEATKDIPALALECTLTKVRPSPFKSAKGVWVEEAINTFKRVTSNTDLVADVYSVVDERVSLTLRKEVVEGNETVDLSINDYLVDHNFAVNCEEQWTSEKNNRIRAGEDWVDDEELWDSKRYIYAHYDVDYDRVDKRIKLGGPFSCLEMRLGALTYEWQGHNITVNGNSVNCVLLDSYSRDPFAKLFVAGFVSQNSNSSALIANNTTMMPFIPGLPWIMALMFTPTAEMRVDEEMTRYTGALCGLGVNSEGKPIYPYHDMELIFDTEISQDDIININTFRFSASAILNSMYYDQTICSGGDRVHFKRVVQDCVRKLVFQVRKLKKREAPPCVNRWTPEYDFHHWTEPTFNEMDNLLTFRPIRGFELNTPQDLDNIAKTAVDRLGFLHKLVDDRRKKWSLLDCELCEAHCKTVPELGAHFSTSGHFIKEERFLNSVP